MEQKYMLTTDLGHHVITWSQESNQLIALNLNTKIKSPNPKQTPAWVKELAQDLKDYCSQDKNALDALDKWQHSPYLNWQQFTTFQKDVYRRLCQIQDGEVLTYGQMAKEIKNPKAQQAVGGALGKNPYPLIIPCHRIVAQGGLGGFSANGGSDLKKVLLNHESANN